MIQTLTFEDKNTCRLKGFPAIHFFTTMQAGNMSPRLGDKNEIKPRTDAILHRHNIDLRSCFYVLPEHGDRIVCISGTEKPREILCDGFLSKAPQQVALVLRPADCLPVLMTTKKQEFIGLIHAGWRGIQKDIVEKAVAKIYSEYDIPPHTICVGIGPSVHRCCYDNGTVAQQFAHNKQQAAFVSTGPLGTRVDLLGCAVKQLLNAGIYPAHISVATACTSCSRNTAGEYLFFSHHRVLKNKTEKEGRFLALISF